MKQREFSAAIKTCLTRKRIDVVKLQALGDEVKTSMCHFLIRRRQPVIREMIPPGLDVSWLSAMGYLYTSVVRGYTFVHTCENKPAS